MQWIAGLLLVVLQVGALGAQSSEKQYSFQVQVNEVTLPFRAKDSAGHPLQSLQLSDLLLRDNGKEPKKILSFTQLSDRPIRVGLLLDVSPSIEFNALARSQDIASMFASGFLHPASDQAFVMKFDFDQKFLTGWNNSPTAIETAVSAVGNERSSRLGGTAIFDALYRGVRDQIAQTDPAGNNSNAIVLFSDGEDNASHARLDDVVSICQRTNTAIYVFSVNPKSRFDAGGNTLRTLAGLTGGRVFYDTDTAGVEADLRTMADDLRDYYLIVYRPAGLKPNGAFHRIRLESLQRGVEINARAGYNAPQKQR
jgi:VWFA-related protein